MILDFGFWIFDCHDASEAGASCSTDTFHLFWFPSEGGAQLPRRIQNPKSKIQNRLRGVEVL